MRRGERQWRGESKRKIDMTEHSAQHMFLLRPLLLQGLFDLSEFFQWSHSPQPVTRRRLSLSLRPSLWEKQGGKSTRKLLLTWRNEGLGLFRYGHFFSWVFFTTMVSLSHLETDASVLFRSPNTDKVCVHIVFLSHEDTHSFTLMEGRHHVFKDDNKQEKKKGKSKQCLCFLPLAASTNNLKAHERWRGALQCPLLAVLQPVKNTSGFKNLKKLCCTSFNRRQTS